MYKYFTTILLCLTICINTIAQNKTEFIQQTKQTFDLNSKTQLQTTKTQTDPQGWTHYRLQQTYKAFP